jgi:non-ribosomal peptide synthetase component F
VRDAGIAEEHPLTAVLGHRHATTFAGILGALFRGHGYVPLNPVFPPDRTRAMLERSQVRCVVVDAGAHAILPDVIDGVARGLVLLLPDAGEAAVAALRERFPQHRVLGAAELAPAEEWRAGDADPNGIAYLLFTSGSTGVPKGVMVAHRNVVAFLGSMIDR